MIDPYIRFTDLARGGFMVDERIGVAIGARIGSMGHASEILVSQTVKDLTAGSDLTFEDAGEHELKGIPDRSRRYRVVE